MKLSSSKTTFPALNKGSSSLNHISQLKWGKKTDISLIAESSESEAIMHTEMLLFITQMIADQN